MLLGLTVRCLPFARVVHMETVESVCSCDALNSPPQILMVNVTSHGHCYRHVGKLDQRCPPTSALRTVTMAVRFDLAAHAYNHKEKSIWISFAHCDTTKALVDSKTTCPDKTFTLKSCIIDTIAGTFFPPSLSSLLSHLYFVPCLCWVFTSTVSCNGC